MLKEEEKYPSKTSLEAEAETIPPRPLSALANSSDDAVRSYFMPDTLNLVKGKSMPSLRYAVLYNRKYGLKCCFIYCLLGQYVLSVLFFNAMHVTMRFLSLL